MQSRLILIADDDIDDKAFFIEAINDIDPDIFCLMASNGQEAMCLLRGSEKVPDFIFLDLNMPRQNGKQCLIEIKKIERLKNVPVVIYTTSKLEEEVSKTQELGASYFLVKPTKYSDLLAALRRVIDERYAHDPGSAYIEVLQQVG